MNTRVVHLLRHGPPARTGLLLGHTDEPALDANCPHVLALGRSVQVSGIVASDLSRASAQATNLARHLGFAVTLDARWRELNFGAWDGSAPEDIDPQALEDFWTDPDANPPPGGERWSCLRARAAAALKGLEDRSLVITHAGAMRAALAVLTGLDHRGIWALDLPYRALLTLRIWPDHSGQVIALRGADA